MGDAQAEIVDKKEGILKKIRSGDYGGARTLVLEALKDSPRLEHASEMLTICDVVCSSEIVFPRYGVDWYWVLQLFSSAKPETIRAQHQKLVSLLQPVKDDIPGTKLALKLVQDAFSVLSDPVKRSAFDTKRNTKASDIPNSEVHEAASGGTIAGSSCGTKRPPHELRGDVRSTEDYTCKKQKEVSRSCSAPSVAEKSPDTAEATNVAAGHAETAAAGRADGSSVSTASVSDDEEGGDAAASSSSASAALPRWKVIQRRALLELIKEFVDSLSGQGFGDPASVAKHSRDHLEIIKTTSGLRVGAVEKLLELIAGSAEELASAKQAAESVGRVDESKIEEAKARLEELLSASMEKEKEAKAATVRERAVTDHVAHLEGLLKESRALLVDTTRRRVLAEVKARTEAKAVSAHRRVVSDMVAHSERVKEQLHALEETETHLDTQLRGFVKALKKKTMP